MTKRSTIALMVATLAAAGTVAMAGCGKHDADAGTSTQARTPRLFDPNVTPLAGKDAGTDSGPRPDPCPGCGMG